MDKYVVVKVRKNVDKKRDYLQINSWASGDPIIVDQKTAREEVAELNAIAEEYKGFNEIKKAFAIYVYNQSDAEVKALTKLIQSAQLQ